jgi:hypothetical protein
LSLETTTEVRDDTEEANNKEAQRIERLAAGFRPALDNIVGPMTQGMLDVYRKRSKPWPALVHAEQEAIAWSIRDLCVDAVRKTFALAAVSGARAAEGLLGKKVTVDDNGATVQLNFGEEFTDALVKLRGKPVALPLIDLAQYLKMRDELQLLLDVDEPPLPLPSMEGSVVLHNTETGEVIPMPDGTGVIVPTAPQPGEIAQLALPPTSDRDSRRAAALRDPEAAGYQDALDGFNSSRNPLEPGTEAYQRYDAAWSRGELERSKQSENWANGRRRRRRGSDGAAEETPA